MTSNGGATWSDITPVATPNTSLYEGIYLAVTPETGYTNYVYAMAGDMPPFPTTIQHFDGVSWSSTQNVTANSTGLAINLIISPADHNVMYCTGTKAFKSTNAGVNWTKISNYNSTYEHADVRALHLETPTLGGTSDVLWMGNDGGVGRKIFPAAWTNQNGNGLNITQFYGLDGSETNPNLIIGGAQDNGAYTYNNGSWSVNVLGDGYDCVIDKNNSNYCYVTINDGNNKIYGSSNAGTSWNLGTLPSPPGSSNTVRPFLQGNDNNFYIGHQNVYKTANPASGWGTAIGNISVSPPLIALDVAPSNNNYIYTASPEPTWNNSVPATGKLFRTINATATTPTWTDITPNIIIPGTTDNPCYYTSIRIF